MPYLVMNYTIIKRIFIQWYCKTDCCNILSSSASLLQRLKHKKYDEPLPLSMLFHGDSKSQVFHIEVPFFLCCLSVCLVSLKR